MKKNIQHRYTPKKKKRNSKKTNKLQNSNKQKGVLLERVIAAMYETPGVKIERNIHHSTTDDKERTREIDVFLTANVAGLPVKYAFQCKNEKQVIDVIKIDSFVGALDDIGIPPQYGVFVSVNGFTEGAIKRAKKAGIRTLVLKGLSEDRLKSEISAAIQHNVYLIPRVEEFTLTNNVGEAEYNWQFFIFANENKQMVGTVADLIFNKWQNGEVSNQIGEHNFEIDVPQGWFQYHKDEKIEPQKITARITVLAVVITIDGAAENHLLLDAETKQLEKFNSKVNFDKFQAGQVVPLKVFTTEQELENFINSSTGIRLTTKTMLPRTIMRHIYYPLSEHVASKVFGQMQKYGPDFTQITREQFDQELIKASENDLFREGTFSLTGKEVPVISTDNDGEPVDVTLLYKKAEYDKIIALKDRFFNRPSKPFGNLLAWAYLEKSRQIFDKARNKTEPQKTRLTEESLIKVKAALEIDPAFLPGIDHLATILFVKEDYREALRALDFILVREPEDLRPWSDRSLAFMKLGELDNALEAINKAKELAEKQENNVIDLSFVLFRRSKILYRLERYEESLSDILKAWQVKPNFVVENLGDKRLIEDIINKVPSLEGILLFVEVLYFRAVEFEKNQQSDTASIIADEAIKTLSSLMKVEQMKGEPLIVGQLDGNLIKGVLLRSSKRLLESGNIEMANDQNEKMKSWFRHIYNEEPDFFETLV